MSRLKVPDRCPKCDVELFCHTVTRTTMSLGQTEARCVTNYSLTYKSPAPVVNTGPDGFDSGSGLSSECIEVECARCNHKFSIDCADKHASDQSGEDFADDVKKAFAEDVRENFDKPTHKEISKLGDDNLRRKIMSIMRDDDYCGVQTEEHLKGILQKIDDLLMGKNKSEASGRAS